MRNYVQPGNVITLIAPANVSSGHGVLVGSMFGVAQFDALQNAEVECLVVGVVDIAKVSAQAWAAGDPIYWDDSAKLATTVAGANTLIGVAIEVAANPSATGRLRLNGPPGLLNAIVEAAAVADLGGTLTGTVDGALADVAAIALSTAGGNTYSDAAVNTAVNTAITSINLQLKEIQSKINVILARLRSTNVIGE
jgi:predicted RecA/RadA family phage recombinase